MLNPVHYQPPIVNTYPVSHEARKWRILSPSEKGAQTRKQVVIATLLVAAWVAVSVGIYFLATTTGHIPNTYYIPILAVPAVLGSIVGIGLFCSEPLLSAPKCEEPGVVEALVMHITRSEIGTLCEHLETRGGVSPLVQKGFLLPEHGKILTDYIAEKANEVPDETLLQTLKTQWETYQNKIALAYGESISLDQFRERDGWAGVSWSTRMALQGDFANIQTRYRACRDIVQGFQSQFSTLKNCTSLQYLQATTELPQLEAQWQAFIKASR